MSFFKRFALSLAVLSFVFSHPGISSASNPPSIVSGSIDEPIVSSDGNDIQVAHVVISVPGRVNEVKSVSIGITSPDVPDHALGVFVWSPANGFTELQGFLTGSDYVNLIPPDANNPDTSSRVIVDAVNRQIEIIYRWTLNDVYGSTFDNDMSIKLKTKPPSVAQALLLQPVFADSELDVDANFDTNSPPDFVAVEDIEVIAGLEPVEVTLEATDVDSDPITYLMISAPADALFETDTFEWQPGVDDIGVENVQFVATDPYGTSTLTFDVIVEEEPIPETGAWTSVSTNGAPDGRSGHSVIWTGSESIVWGGSTVAEGVVGSGSAYDAVTDSWTAIAAAPNDFASSGHAAVWTGDKMLVWGGMTPTGVTNEGHVYDPATDTWTSMSTVNAPTARYDAAAVWTGTELIVWGGVNISGPTWTWLDDGARYNPSTDTWTALSASGLAGRQTPGAAYTNGKVVIWGGSSWSSVTGNVYYADGKVYDVATDVWSDMTTTDEPAGRVGHVMTSVVSDTIVLWGGTDGTNFLDSGAVYDIIADTWTATAMTDVADARMSAVSGGANGTLIVWGGNGVDGLLANGGVYDQPSNAWLATSSVTVPAARQLAGAAWTGTGLFVWGGLGAAGSHENTGGIFTP